MPVERKQDRYITKGNRAVQRARVLLLAVAIGVVLSGVDSWVARLETEGSPAAILKIRGGTVYLARWERWTKWHLSATCIYAKHWRLHMAPTSQYYLYRFYPGGR